MKKKEFSSESESFILEIEAGKSERGQKQYRQKRNTIQSRERERVIKPGESIIWPRNRTRLAQRVKPFNLESGSTYLPRDGSRSTLRMTQFNQKSESLHPEMEAGTPGESSIQPGE